MPLFTSVLILSIVAAFALAFGICFIIRVKRYIGKLPTLLIVGESGVWLAWNIAILSIIFTMPEQEQDMELVAIVLIFVMPIVAAFFNVTWQYLLYRSFKR